MFGKVNKGTRMHGLINYLMGPGRANEHTNQHVIGGSDAIAYAYTGASKHDEIVSSLSRDLDAPWKLLEDDKTRPHVFHVSLAVAPEEGELSDETWQRISADYVQMMGFTGEDARPDCEWVAIRHGAGKSGQDHVHIAVNLVRPDGTRASTHKDFPRTRDACRELERKYDLQRLDSARGNGAGHTYGEQEKARRAGKAEPDRDALRRIVRSSATAASSEAEFVRKVREAGVLIRPRFAPGGEHRVVGFRVGVRPSQDEPVVWFGGGTLSKDLRISQLRNRWETPTQQQRAEAMDEWRAAARGERTAHHARTGNADHEHPGAPNLDDLLDAMRNLHGEQDEHVWEDVASDFSGAFGTWAQTETNPEHAADLRRLSDAYGQCAGPTSNTGRRWAPRPSASYWIAAAAAQRDPSGKAAKLALMRQMAKTTEALFDAQRARGDERRAQLLRRSTHEDFVPLVNAQQREYRAEREKAGPGTSRTPSAQTSKAPAPYADPFATPFTPRTTPQAPERAHRGMEH